MYKVLLVDSVHGLDSLSTGTVCHCASEDGGAVASGTGRRLDRQIYTYRKIIHVSEKDDAFDHLLDGRAS